MLHPGVRLSQAVGHHCGVRRLGADGHLPAHADVRAIADEYDLMLELMVNHISPASDQFQDFLAKGDASEFADMFIDWKKFWGGNGESCCFWCRLSAVYCHRC